MVPIIFFSRRIGLQNGLEVPILAGGRVLGRGNGFQIGALQMHTEASDTARAEATDFSVLRVNRDVLKRSRVGMIATRRAPGANTDADGYTYGADAAINPLQEIAVNGYWAGVSSTTGAAGATGLETQSYRAQVNWNADKTGFQVDHNYVGDRFVPEIGFLRRTAFRRTYGQARFSPRPRTWKPVRKIYYEGSYDYYEDTAGHPESREGQGAVRMELANGDQWAFEYLGSVRGARRIGSR